MTSPGEPGAIPPSHSRYTSSDGGQRLWHIPLNLAEVQLCRTGRTVPSQVGGAPAWEDTRPQWWLTGKSITVTTEAAATTLLLANKLGTGYYRYSTRSVLVLMVPMSSRPFYSSDLSPSRVNYDTPTWSLIANQLRTDHLAIHPLQREAIICDVVSLAATGYVPQVALLLPLLLFQATMEEVLGYREQEQEFGPLLAFKECVDSKDHHVDHYAKDVVF